MILEGKELFEFWPSSGPRHGITKLYDELYIYDKPPTVSIAKVNDAEERYLVEGSYIVTRDGDLYRDLVVYYTKTGGNAILNFDYTDPAGPGMVTIPAGFDHAYITLVPLDDNVRDFDKTVTLTIQANAPNGDWPSYEVGVGSATAAILDDEFSVSITGTGDAYEEDTKAGWLTITRTGRYMENGLTVNYAKIGGKAILGFDYSDPGNVGSIRFAPHETSIDLEVLPIDEPFDDGDKELIIELQPGVRYEVDSPSQGTVNIIDNDDPILAILALDPISAEDPNSTARFVAYAMGDPTSATLFISGTASNKHDYTEVGTKVSDGPVSSLRRFLRIAPNRTSRSFSRSAMGL